MEKGKRGKTHILSVGKLVASAFESHIDLQTNPETIS